MPPPLGGSSGGLPSRVEYLSPQGVLLPLVYGTTASPLLPELRGHSAWQVTPSCAVYRLACHRLLPLLRVTFAMVPDAAWPGSDQWPWSTAPATGPVGRLGRRSASDPWGIGSFLSLGRPTCVQCHGPLGSCSPVCPRGLLWCVCSVLGQLAPVHRCARSVCCVACAVSWSTGLLFTGVRAVCGARVPWVVVSLFLPPQFSFFFTCFFFFTLFFFFFGREKREKTKKRKTGARVHCRHRHGQLVRRCNSVVSSGVCRQCCGGGRAPGVRLARPDVHGYGSGWVWLGVSLLLVLAG